MKVNSLIDTARLKGWPTSVQPFCTYGVPADDKENARLIVSQMVRDAHNGLKMAYPKTTAERRRELKSIRKHLSRGIP
jgi:hypothetical protein